MSVASSLDKIMSNPAKHLKRLKETLEREGLQVLDVRTRRHFCFTVANSGGARAVLTTSKTPSDGRTFLNFRSEARRIARATLATL